MCLLLGGGRVRGRTIAQDFALQLGLARGDARHHGVGLHPFMGSRQPIQTGTSLLKPIQTSISVSHISSPLRGSNLFQTTYSDAHLALKIYLFRYSYRSLTSHSLRGSNLSVNNSNVGSDTNCNTPPGLVCPKTTIASIACSCAQIDISLSKLRLKIRNTLSL